jgi:SAM-dependent methyltransferase
LKFGITSTRSLGRPPRWLGRERHASFLLLDPLARESGPDPAAYDTLVARVRMPNGTWKQTAAGRLRLADDALVGVLEDTRAPGGALSVLDLGASTGVTSVDLYERLSRRWSVQFTATDLYRDAFAVSAPARRGALVLSAAGDVLQHVFGPFVLAGQLEESAAYPVNRALKRWSERVLVPRARRALASDLAARDRPYFATKDVDGLVIQRLPLFSWRCLELLRRTARFRFLVHDVTEPPPTTATIVRAVNIITRDYFDLPTATRAIAHALQAVEPGGYFVAGQSRGLDPAAMRATVFRVHDAAAEVVARIGDGYELEETVRSQAARVGWGRACEA